MKVTRSGDAEVAGKGFQRRAVGTVADQDQAAFRLGRQVREGADQAAEVLFPAERADGADQQFVSKARQSGGIGFGREAGAVDAVGDEADALFGEAPGLQRDRFEHARGHDQFGRGRECRAAEPDPAAELPADRFLRAEAVLEMEMRADGDDAVYQAPLDSAPGVAEQQVGLHGGQDAAEADQVAKAEKPALGDGYGENPDVECGVQAVEAVGVAVHRDDGVPVGRSKAVRDLGETHLLSADFK